MCGEAMDEREWSQREEKGQRLKHILKHLCNGRFPTSQAKVEGSSLPPRVYLHFCAVVN